MDTLCLLAQGNTAGQVVGGFFGLQLILVAILCVVGIAATIFWLWMLVDALTNEPTTNDKILWFLVIFFLHFNRALVYLFVRRSQRTTAMR